MAKPTVGKAGLRQQKGWGGPERKVERQEIEDFSEACELSPDGGPERGRSGVRSGVKDPICVLLLGPCQSCFSL